MKFSLSENFIVLFSLQQINSAAALHVCRQKQPYSRQRTSLSRVKQVSIIARQSPRALLLSVLLHHRSQARYNRFHCCCPGRAVQANL